MGFPDLEQNKRALVATNGDITAAVEYLVVGVVGAWVEGLCRFASVNTRPTSLHAAAVHEYDPAVAEAG